MWLLRLHFFQDELRVETELIQLWGVGMSCPYVVHTLVQYNLCIR